MRKSFKIVQTCAMTRYQRNNKNDKQLKIEGLNMRLRKIKEDVGVKGPGCGRKSK